MKRIIGFFFLTLVFSCDPGCDNLVQIINGTSYTLHIYISKDIYGKSQDTILKQDDKMILFEENGPCKASDLRDAFSSFAESLLVYRNDSLVYNQIPIQKEYWAANEDIASNGEGTAHYTLTLCNDSLR